jgi:hypothetical protein
MQPCDSKMQIYGSIAVTTVALVTSEILSLSGGPFHSLPIIAAFSRDINITKGTYSLATEDFDLPAQ